MELAYALPNGSDPLVISSLTIGNFDGLHLGHRLIFQEMMRIAKRSGKPSAAISFSNHPASILRPQLKICTLLTQEHKTRLLAETGLDFLFLIPFTKELSELTAEQFLNHTQFSFESLVLGEDGALGKDKKGDKAALEHLSSALGFKMSWIPHYKIDGERVSSSRIRQFIEKGNLTSASKCLGRPYSIYARVHKGAGRGASLGIHTANVSVSGLVLPPLGVYAVTLVHREAAYPAVANLGFAPTFRTDNTPVLEVHAWDRSLELSGEYVEVVFHSYIREEKKFNSVDALKQQIADDIAQAKKLAKGA